MKTSARARFFCIVLLLLSWTNVFAQLDLGPNQLLNAPAPTLNDPVHLNINLRSPRFVGRVGGVAFGATAAPAGRADFAGLSLNYRPQERDGNRLWVTVDGRQFPAPIYDWQLVPIAKFADSPYKSCVTLFGELSDREAGRRLLENGDGVLNYNSEFVDTLLGLRLFQLDILIDEPYATDLPKQNGSYILGAGETLPDSNANIGGWNSLVKFRERLASELRVKTRSYVITDEGSDIRFSFDGGGLHFTGEPHIYFFLLKEEFPGYDEAAVRMRVAGEIEREAQASVRAGGSLSSVQEAYIQMLLKELSQDDGRFDDALHPSIAEVLKIRDDFSRRAYLRRFTTESIREVLTDLRVVADANTVVPLTEYSARLSAETGMLRSINPAIWDTGVNVMRYAAFFRYCKAKYPAQWLTFLARLRQVQISPPIRTPAIMKRRGPVGRG